ncbi:enoyl-CoA hydratase/isomerase family protein [Marinobacterium sp. AK62]|uniref:Enoyl-CoA hydratase/isomerase family protein n=1 Tax=Marinobacterium alkalitolerans TaxID=1542925 RepID=A0ABS3Z6V2_9GAMM|nr:enoyl-CoA hydratase-related protein [Marinobacterium alkalitolerans]MBP0047436.1 enoyl-CoA hydratase/isomerase family protein [Marinobacterium alkalitolerans]
MSILEQTQDHGVLTLTLNRAQKRNAFDRTLYAELTAAVQAADQSAEVRVVHLRATGDCFSAGNDIADFLAEPESGRRTDPPLKLLRALRASRKPLVAEVDGKAVGIGATLLLHCDLVYASERAALIFPFVALGLCPEGGSTQLLPQMAGHVKAFEWLVLGEPCSAQEAVEVGLVNRVLPLAELAAEAARAVKRLAQLDAEAVQQSRRCLQRASGEQLDAIMQAEMDLFEQLLEREPAQQALNAFVNR